MVDAQHPGRLRNRGKQRGIPAAGVFPALRPGGEPDAAGHAGPGTGGIPCSVPGLEELKEEISAEDDWGDPIEDYQEHREYDEAGRLVRFRADGIYPSPWSNEDVPAPAYCLYIDRWGSGVILAKY